MFYLDLKQENITEDAYEKAKYLYLVLKMRNIFDLNYLYIYQDVSILSKILENKCEMMHRTYRFNPRLCNLPVNYVGGSDRQKSKILTAMPTNGKIVQLNKKALTCRFSCINTCLIIDLEILMPNQSHEDLNR